jgi:TonB family protein
LRKIRSWKLKATIMEVGNVTGRRPKTRLFIRWGTHSFAHFVKGRGIARSATVFFGVLASTFVLCAQSSCALSGIQSSGTLEYPRIAIAAEISGDMVIHAVFAPDGSVTSVRIESGPALTQMREVATTYVRSWHVNPAASQQECLITISFQLGPSVTCNESNADLSPDLRSSVRMTDLQHFTVTSGPVGYCEDLGILVRRHRFLFFRWNTKLKITDLVPLSKV